MTGAHQVGQYRIVDERAAARPARGRRRRRHRRRRAIAAAAALTAAGLAVGDRGRVRVQPHV